MSRTSTITMGGGATEIDVKSAEEFLQTARARIDTEEKWVKGSWTKGGDYDSSDKSAMCVGRAICGIRYSNGGAGPGEVVKALAEEVPEKYRRAGDPFGAFADFNDADETTHADVMAVFDRALAKLKPTEATQPQ